MTKFKSAGDVRAEKEQRAMVKEAKGMARVMTAQRALLNNLEFDGTGLMQDAGLTWDQRVQWSIAMSLKCISDRLEEGKR